LGRLGVKETGRFFTVFALLPLLTAAYAVSNPTMLGEAAFTVYCDGVVEVEYTASVSSSSARVRLPLFGTPDHIMITDEAGVPLNFTLEEKSVIVDSLGSEAVKVSYSTQDLTSKEGRLWTLSFSTPTTVEILFPSNTVVVEVNMVPEAFSASENGLTVKMPPGTVTISYYFELEAAEEPAYSTPLHMGLIGAGLTAFAFLAYLFLKRRTQPPPPAQTVRKPVNVEKLLKGRPYLRAEDRELIVFLGERGGEAFESEVREYFKLPKTTVWRMVRRLKREELVEVVKVGGQNLVRLRRVEGETGVPEGS